MSFSRACDITDLTDDVPLAVTVGETEVALVKQSGEIFAIEDLCSHAAVPLSDGDVEGCLIECYLHGSTFDLRTGKPTTLPAFEPVAVYPVRTVGTDVLIDVDNPLNTPDLP